MVDKHVLRKVYLEKRLFLSDSEYHSRNQRLIDNLFNQFDFSLIKTVHVFMSIAKQKEVNTFAIIDRLSNHFPNVQIVTSKTLANGLMTHHKITAETEFQPNKWSIPEPVEAEEFDVTILDLVLIPLITFDKLGHRIGYGKGYYDRFLAEIPGCIKCGLSLASPLDKIDYMDEKDISMDHCITPHSVYSF